MLACYSQLQYNLLKNEEKCCKIIGICNMNFVVARARTGSFIAN